MKGIQMTTENLERKDWAPGYKDSYWYIESKVVNDETEYKVISTTCTFSKSDLWNMLIYNCFKIEQEAQQFVENCKVYTELDNLAKELDKAKGETTDWNNVHQTKYCIVYNPERFCLDWTSQYEESYPEQIGCQDIDFLNKAVKHIGYDRLFNMIKAEYERNKEKCQ
jgi:hypothetical protein